MKKFINLSEFASKLPWRQAAVIFSIFLLDLALSLPIMGATYRPFSWMSIAPADSATVYPVIKELTFDEMGRPSLKVKVSPNGGRYELQRTTNLLQTGNLPASGQNGGTGKDSVWETVYRHESSEGEILMIDTNPLPNSVYYRVIQIPTGGR